MNSHKPPTDKDICVDECNSWCCRHFLKVIPADSVEFCKFCGFDLRILKDGRYVTIVEKACKYVTDEGCSIYGTGKRHPSCKLFPGVYSDTMAPYCPLMRKKLKK